MKDIKIKKKYIILAVLTLIVSVGTVTLAYFQGNVLNDKINNTKVTTGKVDVKISDDVINLSNIKPMYTGSSSDAYEDADFVKHFTLENADGNLNACVKLYMKINSIDSALANKYFKYIVVNEETGTTISGDFTNATSGSDLELGSLYFIEANKSRKYTMYIWIEYDSSVDQMAMLNKNMSGTLWIKSTDTKTKDACDTRSKFKITYKTYGGSGCSNTDVNKGSGATLCTPTNGDFTFGGWYSDSTYTNKVTSITSMSDDVMLHAKWDCTFTGTLNQGVEYVNGQYTYRYKQQGSDGDGNAELESSLFWENIDNDGWGVQLTDKDSTDSVTSNVCTTIGGKPVVSASFMYALSKASSVNLKYLNTSNYVNMSGMFGLSNFKKIDLRNFDTSNVVNMSGMFTDYNGKALDLSGFDTSNVIGMTGMFANVNAKTLDVSNFNTSNVTDMSSLFYGCTSDVIGLNKWNTSNVTDMSWMFYKYKGDTIDVSSFDTSNVTDMSEMFMYTIVDTLDLSSFVIGADTDLTTMFYGAKATKGYAKDEATATRLNALGTDNKPDTLVFTVK